MKIIIVDPSSYQVNITLIDTENPEEIGFREYKGTGGNELDANEVTQQIIGLAHLGKADEIWVETFSMGKAIYDNLKYLEDNKAGHFEGTVKATYMKSARAVVNDWARKDRKEAEKVPDDTMFVNTRYTNALEGNK